MEEKYNCESNAAEQLEKLLSINSLARANTVNRNAWNSFEIGFLRILKRTHVFLHTMHNKFISFTRYCQIVKKSPYLFLKTKPTHLYTNQIRKVKFSHHVYFFKRIKRASSLVKLNEHVRRRRFKHARLPLSGCELQFSLLENWPRRHTELTTSFSRTTRRVELSVATGSTSQSSGYFLTVERVQVEKNRHDRFVERIHAWPNVSL